MYSFGTFIFYDPSSGSNTNRFLRFSRETHFCSGTSTPHVPARHRRRRSRSRDILYCVLSSRSAKFYDGAASLTGVEWRSAHDRGPRDTGRGNFFRTPPSPATCTREPEHTSRCPRETRILNNEHQRSRESLHDDLPCPFRECRGPAIIFSSFSIHFVCSALTWS